MAEQTPTAFPLSRLAGKVSNALRPTSADRVFTHVTWTHPNVAEVVAVVDQAIVRWTAQGRIDLSDGQDVLLDVRTAILTWDDEDAEAADL